MQSTGHNDGSRRNLERAVALPGNDTRIHEVVHARASRQDDAGCEHGAATNDATLVDPAAAADEDVLLDDDRQRLWRLEDTADLCRCRNVHVSPDLSATAYQRI